MKAMSALADGLIGMGNLRRRMGNLRRCIESELGLREVAATRQALLDRGMEPLSAEATAIALTPVSRRNVERSIDSSTVDNPVAGSFEEIIIGSGVHAAVYAAARKNRPAVFDRGRLGGVFALAERPVFYLNSRNRPECGLRLPGTRAALNTELGALIRPSLFSGSEYQTQADLAFATRLNLLLHAQPFAGAEVTRIRCRKVVPRDGFPYAVYFTRNGRKSVVQAKRVIISTGVGEPKVDFQYPDDPRVMLFADFITRIGSYRRKFPLQDYKNVAVIGAPDPARGKGDAAGVTVEYLLGQGPDQALSVAELDYVERIFWVGQNLRTKEQFEAANRSRYAGIGRYMPREDPRYYYRVEPTPGRAAKIEREGEAFVVTVRDGMRESRVMADHVIICTGYRDTASELLDIGVDPRAMMVDGRAVAMKYPDSDIYRIGPAAAIPVTARDRAESPVLDAIDTNSVAIWRYAERTAALAKAV